jgi:hypothetical protein
MRRVVSCRGIRRQMSTIPRLRSRRGVRIDWRMLSGIPSPATHLPSGPYSLPFRGGPRRTEGEPLAAARAAVWEGEADAQPPTPRRPYRSPRVPQIASLPMPGMQLVQHPMPPPSVAWPAKRIADQHIASDAEIVKLTDGFLNEPERRAKIGPLSTSFGDGMTPIRSRDAWWKSIAPCSTMVLLARLCETGSVGGSARRRNAIGAGRRGALRRPAVFAHVHDRLRCVQGGCAPGPCAAPHARGARAARPCCLDREHRPGM